MSDGEYHKPVRLSKEEAIRLGIIKPEPKPTLSNANREVARSSNSGVGYARLSATKKKQLFPVKKVSKAKRRKIVTSAQKKERFLRRKEKEAVRGATGVLKHITATPEERAAAVKKRRRL